MATPRISAPDFEDIYIYIYISLYIYMCVYVCVYGICGTGAATYLYNDTEGLLEVNCGRQLWGRCRSIEGACMPQLQ